MFLLCVASRRLVTCGRLHPSSFSKIGFCACRRFPACWNTRDRGPSATASVISCPRLAGGHGMTMASAGRLVHLVAAEDLPGPGLRRHVHADPGIGVNDVGLPHGFDRILDELE